MKRVLLYILTPLITFTLGFGASRLISKTPVQTPPQPTVDRLTDIPAPDANSYAPEVAQVQSDVPTLMLILDYPEKEMGLFASFSIVGPKPKEFADFEVIEIGLPPNRNAETSAITVHEQMNETWNQYNASFALVTERKLFFVTSKGAESEFEYRFDGEFVRTDFEELANKKITALRGKLTKTKNGRKIAERTVSLRMEYHSC